jgi:hypothetical protein
MELFFNITDVLNFDFIYYYLFLSNETGTEKDIMTYNSK